MSILPNRMIDQDVLPDKVGDEEIDEEAEAKLEEIRLMSPSYRRAIRIVEKLLKAEDDAAI